MAAPLIGKLVIFGVGLIGGSFALALKRSAAVGSVVGIGRGRANLDVARAQGIADRTYTIDEAWHAELQDADLVLLAAPVGQLPDLLSAIVGQFASHQDEGDEPMVIEREDGSLLIAGALPVDALADRLSITIPTDRDFATVAGYVLSVLKRLPREGETFTVQGWRFEIVDMDERRIDKLLVSRIAPEPEVT